MDVSPLSERLAEVIEEYSEANPVTVAEVMDALEYVYACVEIQHDITDRKRMH